MERLLVNRSRGFVPDYEEVEAAVLSLDFDGGMPDPALEVQLRYTLESFGAVEIACLDDYATVPGSKADYLVRVEDDVHELCGFSAYAVPQLRALGWHVDVADDYRWQVVQTDAPWYATLSDDDGDWFSLELGVEVGGCRVNLLPTLLDMLDGAASLRSLARSSRRCIAVPLDERRYVPLEPESLRRVLKVLLELYSGDPTPNGALRFPAAQTAALAGIDAALEERVEWDGDTDACERAIALATGPAGAADVVQPRNLRATLRPYQAEGLAWLQHLRAHDAGGILADDMGLGKTLQTIAHLALEKEMCRSPLPSLVVAPTSLVGNWRRELRKFAPHMSSVVLHGPRRHAAWSDVPFADVVITTYPILVRDKERFDEHRFHICVLDEAQTIKNRRSQAHKAACALRANHRVCLSGTPVENDLGELWSQFNFLMPGMLGDAARFKEAFRIPIERESCDDRLDLLRERVSPFIMRRTKDEVAKDLPKKTEIVRAVDLDGDQRELYESIRMAAHARVRKTIAQKGISSSTIAILDALMKLRQVCCDPRLVGVAAARDVERSAKYQFLFELLPQQLAQGRRALVFSQFTGMLALIADGLAERGIRYSLLTGSTRDRQAAVDEFEGRHTDVFLISLKAGGTGLNLTSADTVIHYDPWWNPAAQAQATDRAYRIGQTKPVFVYNLIAAGSVEERMLQLQERKRHLAQSILAPGGGVGLDEREVDDLFAPLG